MPVLHSTFRQATETAFWAAQKQPFVTVLITTQLQHTTKGLQPIGFEAIPLDTAEAILAYYDKPRNAILSVTFRHYPPAKPQFDMRMCGIGTELTAFAETIITSKPKKD